MFRENFPILSETFVVNQIIGLMDRGHEVDIYTFGKNKQDFNDVHDDVREYSLQKRTTHIKLPDLNNKQYKLKFVYALVLNFFKDPYFVIQFLNPARYAMGLGTISFFYKSLSFLGKKPYNIVHGQFGVDSVFAMSLKEVPVFKKAKLITTFRGFDITKYVKENGRDCYDDLFSQGDAFITNCQFFKEKLLDLGCPKEKIAIIVSGIDYKRYPFKEYKARIQDPVRIVTVGRFVEKKGIEYGIQAVAKLIQKKTNIRYDIIGFGPLEEKYKELINDLGVSQQICILGWKNQNEIKEILNRSQLFLAPSVTASDGNQDAPVNTLKEAMCLGLPVISTNHGGIPELVKEGQTGFLVPEKDVDAIAEKIRFSIDHPEICEKVAQSGRQFVEKHYDLHELNDKLVDIYKNI